MTGARSPAKFLIYLLILYLASVSIINAQKSTLIPYPAEIEWNKQEFCLDKAFSLQTNIGDEEIIISLLKSIPGFNRVPGEKADQKVSGGRVVKISLKEFIPEIEMRSGEAYTLEITTDSVILDAKEPAGLYYGIMTLEQLVIDGERPGLEGCKIVDWPAFPLRGFMIDAGRNYIPVEMLKEILDVMVAYKLNLFHFHLTDNPGWRLESKIYPSLNDPSSMSRWPGRYYSHDDFRELIQYCSSRFITLVPEFDIPGHSEAFRKGLGIDSMSDPEVKSILVDLLTELFSLAPPGVMPYIHIGTDEVSREEERASPDLLPHLLEHIIEKGRDPVVWRPGYYIEGDTVSITQLWSSGGRPKEGHRYLDSRLNYLNHLDPLSGVAQLYFDRIGGMTESDSLCLGGILCCWNDNNVSDIYDILRHNPVYPGILTYSQVSWHGQKKNTGEKYLAKFPAPDNELFAEFSEFEDRLVQHRDKYFESKPFPYVKQTGIKWSLIGPFDNRNDAAAIFPVENSISSQYAVDSLEYKWLGPVYGGTVNIHHFFNYPSYFSEDKGTVYAYTRIWSPRDQEIDAWIGFHDWSRSGGRRGGPFPSSGQWHTSDPWVKVNGELIPPPEWNNPGLPQNSEEIPFSDENYSFREPSKVSLRKGWNTVLLKIPKTEDTWKWMFTFVPLSIENGTFGELNELLFDNRIEQN